MIRNASSTTYSMKAIPLVGDDENLYNLYLYDEDGEVSEQIVKYKTENTDNPFSDENTEIIYSTRGTCLAIVIAPCEYGNWHDDEHCEADGWVVIYLGDCGNSGGGGGGGNDDPGSGNSDDPVTPVGHDPGDGSGSGGGGYTTPACTSLKNKLNEPLQNGNNFKTRLQELRDLVSSHSPNEHGYINQNPNENPDINSNQTNQYNSTYGTNPHSTSSPFLDQVQTFGYMHTHRIEENVAGIHSMADIKIFVDMVRRRVKAGLPIDNTYGIVVGPHGINALKIDNVDDFMAGYGAISRQRSK